MAGSLVGGAALGPVFDIFLKSVIDVGVRVATFRSKMNHLKMTLEYIKPVFEDIENLNRKLEGRDQEIELLKKQLQDGEKLVLKCSKAKPYDMVKKWHYSRKMTKLENSLLQFFQMHGLLCGWRDSKRSLGMTIENSQKLDKICSFFEESSLNAGSSRGFSGWSDVPEFIVPDFFVGLQVPLQELKLMLLKEDIDPVVVISAPVGCGKTTLASKLCQDEDIKGRYRDIFFVTVSRKPNIRRIVSAIFEKKVGMVPDFPSDQDAIFQLNSLIQRHTSHHVLLVLDDVWYGSELLVEKFIFDPRFKILVTSRSVFPKFESTYKLKSLSEKDARDLFHHSAFRNGTPNVGPDLVDKVIRSCSGFPLALKVVGGSLYGQPDAIWIKRVKMQPKRNILFATENDLFCSLEVSINALDEIAFPIIGQILGDCFMDLGSFPEDQRIHATTLLDMWVELYNLDEDGMSALGILFELCSQNVVNLALARKDAPACLGLYNVHYITQHDLLRELAIHRCDEKPVEERRRLYVNIKGNDFPKWWFDQRLQPVQARLLSIFTEETFSIDWYDMQFPYVEVLVLNFQTTVCTYKLPQFMEKMSQLKALIVTNNGFSLAELSKFSVLCSLPNLNRINLERISIASVFTGNLQLTNLRKISLIMCEVGKAFSNSVVKMSSMWPNLVEMNLEYCNDLVILPADICDLVHLKKLSICYCQELIALPEEVGKLENLEILRLQSCTKLTELPESIVKLQRLCFLDVYDCVDMDSMPMEIGQLSSLQTICMGSRLGFDELPRSVINLVKLEHVICDEETALLWEQYKGCLRNLRINVLKEDINLNLICCINHHLI